MKNNLFLIIGSYMLILNSCLLANVTKAEISTLYVSIFNRASEGSGNRYWQGEGALSNIANKMLNTGAAKKYFGSSLDTNQAFIEHIYKNTLNKTIEDDRDGITYWVEKLSTKSRGEIVVALINAIASYAPEGVNYNPNDQKTVDAYNQFTNRVTVSNYMADKVEQTPSDYETSTNFAKGLKVTSDKTSVNSAKNTIDRLVQKNQNSSEQGILYSVANAENILGGSIYMMDVNGANSKKVFDFSKLTHYTDNVMLDLSFHNGKIYFVSHAGWLYGPAYFNIFEVGINPYSFNQITPGENSGVWGKIGTGTVTGVVQRSNGEPYSGVPVFLEGKDMVYTDANGRFTFSNVADGYYWLNATRGGGSDVHNSQFIKSLGGTTSGPWNLVPDTSGRWLYLKPKFYQNRIYYIFSPYVIKTDIKYTNVEGTIPHTTVLTYDGDKECGYEFDSFDVGKKTGQLLIVKYVQGKSCLGGVYTADKDGNNYRQIIDMSLWNNIQDLRDKREIFWNSDETLFTMNIAIQNNFQTYEGILVFNKNGELQSQIYAPASIGLSIYGWSRDDREILYSTYSLDNQAIKKLLKISVSDNGILDENSIVTLIESEKILSATWIY